MADKHEELILGLPRSVVIGHDSWHGIRSSGMERYLSLIGRAGQYRKRGEAEQDPSWKQVIPYLLLRDREQLFLMRRTRAGGDARLHERWSIGIGGHLNPEDGDVRTGLAREFHEELHADWEPKLRLVGLLNDDSTPVGQVHLGVVFMAEAAGPVAIRETEKLSGEFASPETVRAGYDHLETWSQIVFDHVTDSIEV